MSNLKDTAMALAITATIADAAKEHKDYLRDQLIAQLDELGADATSAELDGEKVAKVSRVAGKPKAYITAEHELVWYVEANYKEQTYTKVREAFWTHLQSLLVPTEDGQAINSETGEIVPGVRFKMSTPYVSTRFEKQGREAILEALRNGRLALDLTEAPNQLTEGTDK